MTSSEVAALLCEKHGITWDFVDALRCQLEPCWMECTEDKNRAADIFAKLLQNGNIKR